LILSASASPFSNISYGAAGGMKSLQLRLGSSVDDVSMGVRLTKDRKWVVLSNPFFKDEERSVQRVHTSPAGKLRREVLLLDQVLALFATHPRQSLYLDVLDIGEERQLVKLVKQYGLEQQVVFISWEQEVLRRIHVRDATLRLGFSFVPVGDSLHYVRGLTPVPRSPKGVLLAFNPLHSFTAKHKPDNAANLSSVPDLPLYSLQVPAGGCTKKFVTLAHKHGCKVYAFQATRLQSLLLKRSGADGAINVLQ
jgi:glycerophosphoryl diester phosphodiesterase